MAISPKTAQEQLNALRQAYAQHLPEKVHEIEVIWKSLLEQEWNQDALKTLHRLTHSLNGSSATFGFNAVRNLASTLETLLKSITESGVQLTTEQRVQINASLDALKQAAIEFNHRSKSGRLADLPIFNNSSLQAKDNKLVFLVEDDAMLAQDLAVQIEQRGYSVRVFLHLNELKQVVLETPPAAIVADMALPEGSLAGANAVSEVQRLVQTPLSVIFISVRDDIEARLSAVRAGGTHYFARPLDVSKLIDTLDELTTDKPKEPYRILIVDDDAPLATFYTLILEKAGMSTTTVTNPLQVMEPLVNFKPELILMDVYMPSCNGMELAATIRQQNVYAGIPIVFLSSESNFDKQLMAMNLGGDDFLTKPIQPKHLVSAVTARVERARQLNKLYQELEEANRELQHLAVSDGLTQVANRRRFDEYLGQEWQRMAREDAPLSLLLCDVDFFKSYNDTYGHQAGDDCLRQVARAISCTVKRPVDLVARYGGEEFAVILPNTNAEGAVQVAEKVRSEVKALEIVHANSQINKCVTLSLGVASTVPCHKSSSAVLISAADEALYQAKAKGRNCVVMSTRCSQPVDTAIKLPPRICSG
jgi:diguanylate cyclase (GGDEF)-like protein